MTSGLIEMLTINIDYFKSKPVELPITTILLDNGYHLTKIEEELKKVYPDTYPKREVWEDLVNINITIGWIGALILTQ